MRLLASVSWISSVALALLSITTASAQTMSNSKLSAHLINGYTPGSSNIVAGLPRVLKVLALDTDFPSGQVQAMRDYKAKLPGGKVVVRVYSPKLYFRTDDATWAAGDFWTNILERSLNRISASDRALIDFLEGPNEGQTPTLGYDPGGTNGAAASQWFNQFWTNLTPRIAAAGYKPCIGSIAVGNPGSVADLDWFVPALRQAKAVGGAWSYHSYTINYTTDVGEEVWYSLRYRQFYDYFRQQYADLADIPLILTEGGVDFNGSPNSSGWQARGTTASYQRWLNWFDCRMQEDSYVLGCTLFQNGDPGGWASFDLEVPMNAGVTPVANWLGRYLTNPTDFPAAPSGLSAMAINSRIRVTWTSVPEHPTTYVVKRSRTPGGPYTPIASNISEGVSATSFDDSGCPSGTASYYVVSAVTAFGESENSGEVSATPSLPKINCGGGATDSFGADAFFSGSLTYAPDNAIDLTGATSPAPMAVYQSQRYGNLTYTIPGLPPAAAFKVRLHFAEVYHVFNSPGQRVFNVFINGSRVLNGFDIVAAAGGQFKATVQEFNAISDPSGRISIQLQTIVDNASINGIEVLASAANSVPAAPAALTAVAGTGKVTLTWVAPEGATRFTVKRSTSNGGPYSIIGSNLWPAKFEDVSFIPNTTYYYVVSASNTAGESENSVQASARPVVALADLIVKNITWTPVSPVPGSSILFRATVLNQGSAASPSTNHGVGFSVNGTLVSWASSTVSIPAGQSLLFTANGGPNGAYWTGTAGNHAITAHVDDVNRFPEAVEDNNTLSVPLNIFVAAYSNNCGGGSSGRFSADAGFSGSPNTCSITNAIDTSGASAPAPQAVYQSERWGPVKYRFSHLVPTQLYKVRLHFAEISPSVNQAGDRLFNASLNGTQVLANFDILQTAGAKFRAVSRQFNVTADETGEALLYFWRGAANEPKCSGIEVFAYTNTPPALDIISDHTINAGRSLAVTNTAADSDVPADVLTFSLVAGPAGSALSTSGIFSWTAPQATQAQTNTITIRVTDNGTPPLIDTKSFNIIVIPPPQFGTAAINDSTLSLGWKTFPGKSYQLQFKTNLNATNWTNLGTTNVAEGFSLEIADGMAGAERYYRLLQLD